MEPHVRENREPAASTQPGQYKATPIDFTADENFPVFLPVRFTPSMWALPGNNEIPNPSNGKDQASMSMRNSADKERPMTSSVYNPTPYCKPKQPFATVSVQKSQSTHAVIASCSNKRRKIENLKESTSFNVRKFKTVTPYRKPKLEAISMNNGQIKSETIVNKTSTATISESSVTNNQNLAATWLNTKKITNVLKFGCEKRQSRPSPRFPVPYRKSASDNPAPPATFLIPENFKGFDSEALKKMNVSRLTPKTSSALDLNEAVVEIERYYLYILNIFENISKEPTQWNRKVNCKYLKSDVIRGGKELDKYCDTRWSPKKIDESSSDTDRCNTEESRCNSEDNHCNVGQTLMETFNLRVFLRYNMEIGQKMRSISSDILLWLFWFLKRYLFLTFILIRLFH